MLASPISQTSGPLAEPPRLQVTSPVEPSYSRQTKDDNLPPLPTPHSEVSSPSGGFFGRISKRLRPATTPEPLDVPPTPFQISLPSRSRSNQSRSRSRGRTQDDAASGANAPQPDAAKPRRPNVRISTVPVPAGPKPSAFPNSFSNAETRRAAMRARGLAPPPSRSRYKDVNGEWMPLSEQEKELDRMFAVVVQGTTPVSDNEETEAKKFRDAWLARYRAEIAQSSGEAGQGQLLPSVSDAYANGDAAPTGALGLIFPSTSASVPTLPSLAPPEPSAHARHPNEHGGAARGRRVHDNYRPELVPLVDPSLPEVSPEDATAQRSPQARDRRSSEVSERVSRWLQNSLRPRSRSQSASRDDDAGGGSGGGGGGGGRFGLFSKRYSIDASIIPTPYCAESDARRAEVGGRASSARSSIDSTAAPGAPRNRRPPPRKLPPVPPSAFTPVKERHELDGPIVVTATSPSDSPASQTMQSNGSRTSLDEQGNLRVRRVQVGHRRGRSITSSDHDGGGGGGGGGGPGSSSHYSHGHGMPALSPTRSTSSSEMGLPATPTTDTHGDPPPPPPRDYRPGSSGGRSQSQSQHGHPATTAAATQASLGRGKSLPPPPTRPVPPLPAEAALAEDDEDGEDSGEGSSFVEVDMEFGVKMQNEAQKMRALMAAAASASARPAPVETRRRPTLVGTLFTKKDEVEGPPRFKNPRAATSMQNMKRAVTGTFASLTSRPKTMVIPDNASDKSHSTTSLSLGHGAPPMPPAPPSSFPQARVSSSTARSPKRKKSSMSALSQTLSPTTPTRSSEAHARPRQAVAPKIHDRGSIYVEAARIEDEESRRLSEMAFLDY
ncbi:hypothetical protein FOMPIDRAFT_1023137 [Fomitopsis schrenkii]|uniref:Uncharacterized protein n=1 Tax=Fomitopsis schrenkii TaxID=2126942 RepID=S8FTX2_FOMSC|nr:hypothetical protein FOMPIDRAFT_1023137 [Fomitopsis schrenkii]